MILYSLISILLIYLFCLIFVAVILTFQEEL